MEKQGTKKLANRQVRQPDVTSRKVVADSRATSQSAPNLSVPKFFPERVGVVICADIAEFSKKPAEIQQKLVWRLWEFLSRHPLLTGREDCYPNCTGDGVLVAFSVRERSSAANQFDDYITLAFALAKGMEQSTTADKEKNDLRIGLHYGDFAPMRIMAGGIQAIGSACNYAQRVCAVADGGQVIVSDAFHQQHNSDDHSRFRFSDAYYAFAKHDQQILVRVANESTQGNGLPKFKMPDSLRRVAAIDTEVFPEVFRNLTDLARLYIQDDLKINVKAPIAVSLFVAEQIATQTNGFEKRLIGVEPRFSTSNEKTGSGIAYPFNAKLPGPLITCFNARKCLAFCGFPSSANHSEYCDAVAKTCRLDRAVVASWPRKPRAFFVFPWNFLPESTLMPPEIWPLEGVCCVSLDDPLVRAGKKRISGGKAVAYLTSIAEEIRLEFSPTIYALWQLKKRG